MLSSSLYLVPSHLQVESKSSLSSKKEQSSPFPVEKKPITLQEKSILVMGYLIPPRRVCFCKTKQKIRENGNKYFIYTCDYESRLKKEDERLQVPLLHILSHNRLKRLHTHFCSPRERED